MSYKSLQQCISDLERKDEIKIFSERMDLGIWLSDKYSNFRFQNMHNAAKYIDNQSNSKKLQF